MSLGKKKIQMQGAAGAAAAADVVLYTGNGTGQSISTLEFQPDLVFIRHRNLAAYGRVYDSVRGTTKEMRVFDDQNEVTDSTTLTSFDSNGFTIGSSSYINNSLYNYVAFCFKAAGFANTYNVLENGTTTSSATSSGAGITAGSNTNGWKVSANRDAGISIVQFTGTGTDTSVGHGLTTKPEIIFISNLDDNGDDWHGYIGNWGNSKALNMSLNRNDTQAGSVIYWLNEPTSSVFSLYRSINYNTSNERTIAYCFHSVDGVSKIGSYTGNGSASGPTISGLTFAPKLIIWIGHFNTSQTTDYYMPTIDTVRNTSNPATTSTYMAGSAAEHTNVVDIDFNSDGFTINTSNNEINESGKTFTYMAFA